MLGIIFKSTITIVSKTESVVSNVEKGGISDQSEGINHKLIGIYFFKVNNGNSRRLCEITSELTIKTSE